MSQPNYRNIENRKSDNVHIEKWEKEYCAIAYTNSWTRVSELKFVAWKSGETFILMTVPISLEIALENRLSLLTHG